MLTLLVDDSKLSRNMLKHYVFREYPDVEVIEESDGADGLKAYVEREPHLTILDLTMPGMDGFEFLKKVGESGKKGEIAVLSADIQEASRRTAISLGADYYITKPIKVQLSKINHIVNSVRSKLGMESLTLTEWQKEFLRKIFQDAAAKAAETLSSIIQSPVEISIPSVDVVDRAGLGEHLTSKFTHGEKLVVIRQSFGGNFQGGAFLIFKEEEAKEIAHIMNGIPSGGHDPVEAEKDAILELGNILMGACVGAFGNTMEIPLQLYPVTQASGEEDILDDTSRDPMLLRCALVAKASLIFKDKGVERVLALVTSISSMKVLMSYLDEKLK